MRVDEGFSTREREAAELTGMKYETVMAIRKREEEARKDAGLVETSEGGSNPPSQQAMTSED